MSEVQGQYSYNVLQKEDGWKALVIPAEQSSNS